MGGIVEGIFGGGGSEQTSTTSPQDVTPSEFTGLRPEIAQQFQNLFAQGGGQTFPGQTAAPLGGNEQQLLNQAMQGAQPSQATQTGQNFLQNLLAGGQPVGQPSPGQLSVNPQNIQGGVNTGQTNPFLADAITAAQRPLVDEFQDITAPALRAEFTQAGQQISGQGSSPFQMAAARAQSGLANAMGDIGSELAFQDLSQRQQLQSQEFQQLRDLMVGQELEGRGQDITARGQDIQGQLQGRQQQLEAVGQAAGIDSQQLENTLANLEAQALPRLVEQLGIDAGLEEFRRREDQLLQALQMSGQLASPTVASVQRTQGSQSSSGPFGEALGGGLGGALASGIGAMFSSRDFKDDIIPADEGDLAKAIREVELAEFVYKPEMGIPGQFVGAIVEDTPEVFHGADGKTLNAYNLVSGLIAASHEKDRQIAQLEARLAALEESHG